MPKVSDEHRASRRKEVLDAARRCFVRRGFHRTSMQDLLREANLSSGAVYGYFSSKNDVITAIAQENVEIMTAALSEAEQLGRDTPASTLGHVFEVVRREEAACGFARVAVEVWAEATRDAELRARLNVLLDAYRERFGDLAVRTGIVPASASADAVGIFFSVVMPGFILHLVIGGVDSVDGFEDTIGALFPGRGEGAQ